MKKLFMLVGIAVMLAGCAGAPDAVNLTEDIARASIGAIDITSAQSAAINMFAEELYTQVRKEGGENAVISPLSAYFALAMTAAGAEGETAAAFEEALGANADCANDVCLALSRRLTEKAGSTKLLIANSLWLDPELSVEQDFLQTATTYYAADVFHLAKNRRESVDDINEWVSDNTNKLVPEMLTQLPDEIVMLLIDTLYMDARWQDEFDPQNTYVRNFTLANGETIRTDFMNSGIRPLSVIDDGKVQGVLLPYDDGRLAFLAVKPLVGGLEGLALDDSAIGRWCAGAETVDRAIVSMPKFTHSYDITLNEALKAMGLSVAFDSARAEFSGIGTMNGQPLYIDTVLQKVQVRVHEKGTEAAAATAVMMAAGAIMEEPVSVVLDSPFLYAIVELDTGIPLFIGAVDHPVQ